LETTLKIYEKTIGESMVSDGLKLLKSIEKKKNTLLDCRSFKKNNEKSMPKWLPKVMKNAPKWSPGAPRIDLFFVFINLWRRRKNLIFR
jgi:hypothetical protein